jgi:hypothetical protein
MTQAEIENLFMYHAPNEAQIEEMKKLREKALSFAMMVSELTPVSPEQTLAIRAIHLASMHANSAIALHSKKP